MCYTMGVIIFMQQLPPAAATHCSLVVSVLTHTYIVVTKVLEKKIIPTDCLHCITSSLTSVASCCVIPSPRALHLELRLLHIADLLAIHPLRH